MPTCRFCNEYGLELDCVHYGRRHYAHYRCFLEAKKPLSILHAWQIKHFPYRLLVKHGVVAEADRILNAEKAKANGETR